MQKSIIVLILSLISVLSFAQTTGIYTSSNNDSIVTTINGQSQSWDYCTWTYDNSMQTSFTITGQVSVDNVTTLEVCLRSGDELVTVSYNSLDEEVVYTSTEGVFYYPVYFVDYNTSMQAISVYGESFSLSCLKGSGSYVVQPSLRASDDSGSSYVVSGIQFYNL